MTQGVSNNSGVSSVIGPSLGPSTSLQLMFAKLQLELSQTARTQAEDRMEAISKSQEEQKQVAELLNQARQLKADAEGGTGNCPWDKKASMMTQEMKDYMDKNKLAYDKTGNDLAHNPTEWDVAITALQSRLEQLGTDTQQQMVYIQDYMGQYNSYLQGANTQISNSNQTLASLARGQ